MTALTSEQQERFALWRNIALQRMPYFAPILFGMVPQHSTRIRSMAVDAQWRLTINFDAPEYRNTINAAEDLLHECGHVFLRHAERAATLGVKMGSRAFNIAADAEWNDDLVEAGCATIAATGVLPSHLGMPDFETVETYYRAATQNPASQGTGADPSDHSSGDEGDPTTAEPYDGCGSGAGGEPSPVEGTLNPDQGLDADQQDELLQSAATLIKEASEKQRGTVPGGVLAQAETLLAPPKVDWRRVLAAAVRLAAQVRPSGNDWTYRRPSRRRTNVQIGPGKRAVFPSTVRRVPKIVVVRDTSGSMSSADLNAATAEIEGIAKAMGVSGDDYLIRDVDAAAYEARQYRGVQTLATVQGRGGTDMRVGIDAALTDNPDAIIVITDGYTPWPDEAPRGARIVACIVARDAQSGQYIADEVPDFIRTAVVDLSS